MAGPPAVEMVAQKYLPEVIAGITHPLDYRDARVEKDKIVVKSKQEMDLQLRGWIAYEVPVKKGKLGRAVPVVIGEPTPIEFVTWAKEQSVKTLREYLKANKITATGNIIRMLAYRLALIYEELWGLRNGKWPLKPEQMEARKQNITKLNVFINEEGVGNNPDETAIVQKMFFEDWQATTLTKRKESTVADKNEKRSDTLKRLRAQAEAAEADEKKGGKSSAEKEPADKTKSQSGEVDAVKAGKKRTRKASAEPDKKSTSESAAESDAVEPTEGASNVSKKKTTKAAKKATKADKKKVEKPVKAAKEKPAKKVKSTAKAKDFPVGCKVKYIGTRVKHHVGKTGEVTAHKGEIGLAIKWSDGLVATATAGAVEKVGK